MEIRKKVNHLPVLTWNKLDFNEATLSADVTFAQKEYRKETELPEGMRLAGTLDRAAFVK